MRPASSLFGRRQIALFGSRGELVTLVGGDDQETGDVLSTARRLRQLGARDCIITLGAGGCLVVGDRVEPIPGLKVSAVDSTAAGDAFNGVLAVALAEGRDLTEAARWANRAAALSVTRAGAQPSLPTRSEIEAL